MTHSPTFLNFNNSLRHNSTQPLRPCKQIGMGNFDPLKPFLTNIGILHHHPYPSTPEQNNRVKQNNRDVVEKGLSLLVHASMSLSFWHYVFQSVVYFINRLSTPILSNKTLFELLYHSRPSDGSIHVFGCTCFPFLQPYNQSKLQFHYIKCVFLGINFHHKCYLCLQKDTGCVYIFCHVVFNELSFPFHSSSSSPSSSPPTHQPFFFLFSTLSFFFSFSFIFSSIFSSS